MTINTNATPAAPSTEAAPTSDLAGAQFAAKQHLQTVQAQAERITALEAKCDLLAERNAALTESNILLAASLKQADGKVDRLVEALKDAHPHVAHAGARIAIGATLAAVGAA